MYEPHKDNLERVSADNRRMVILEKQCQEAIRDILDGCQLEARFVFYPKHKGDR